MPKAHVDKDTCIGCGLCVGTRPDVFEFDDDGKAEAVNPEVDELEVECPVGAISVED